MPAPDDGIVDVPGDDPMSAVDTVLEQGFVETHRRLSHSATRLQDANDNVSEQTKLGYLTEQRVVGVREAKASTMLQPVVGQPVPVGLGGSVGVKTGA